MFILLHPSCQSYVLLYWIVLLARTNSEYFNPVLLQIETVPPARLLVWLRVLTGWFGWVGTLRGLVCFVPIFLLVIDSFRPNVINYETATITVTQHPLFFCLKIV